MAFDSRINLRTSALAERRADWLEHAALGASALCLVHCLALPLLFALLPTLSGLIAVPETVHLYILAFAVPSSGVALFTGRARHGALWPLAVGAAGLSLLALGVLVFGAGAWETPVTVLGSLSLAWAHLGNWRLRHACHCHACHSDTCQSDA